LIYPYRALSLFSWDWGLPVQDSGGGRQFHFLWWQALGRIFAEEHSIIEGSEVPSDLGLNEELRNIGRRIDGDLSKP
jgi:hypothetical protein